MKKVKAGILGSTGIVGQVFLWMLSKHPVFEIDLITASSTRYGKKYKDEVNWLLPFEMPPEIGDFLIQPLDPAGLKGADCSLLFSALPSDVAQEIEPILREEGFRIFSNAGAMRQHQDVPILIPEVNMESLDLIFNQGYPAKGFVVTNANCSVTGLAVAIAPLKRYGIKQIYISTYQSISGAGYPGISALDIHGNAIPYIENEEEKIEFELKKILNITPEIYTYCVRIPTIFGHLETVWIRFEEEVSEREIINAWNDFKSVGSTLYTGAEKPIVYCYDDHYPQSKMAFYGNSPGMVIYTGRLRKVNGMIGFTLMVNNIVKGAAGGSIQNAELFIKRYEGER